MYTISCKVNTILTPKLIPKKSIPKKLKRHKGDKMVL